MAYKLTYNHVKEYIENTGYKLLSTEYVNVQIPLLVQCDKEHEPYYVRYYNFQQGKRCPTCTQHHGFDTNFMLEYIKSKGYTTTSTTYKKYNTKLHIICNLGHSFDMSFGGFYGGSRCPVCAINNKRHSFSYVNDVIEKNGYMLISTEYKNTSSNLKVLCPENHEFDTCFARFQKGKRCPVCYKERIKTALNTEEYDYYRLQVGNLTNKNYRKYKHIINPDCLPRGRNKYHLDHKYSVYDGFINNISPEIIASVNNLQMLSEHDNICKHKNSCITLQELHKRNNI